uniref:hypothetical protein n=1 Tax=Aquitalea magnusonii TaxID=332411 RepID=UPI001379A7F5
PGVERRADNPLHKLAHYLQHSGQRVLLTAESLGGDADSASLMLPDLASSAVPTTRCTSWRIICNTAASACC